MYGFISFLVTSDSDEGGSDDEDYAEDSSKRSYTPYYTVYCTMLPQTYSSSHATRSTDVHFCCCMHPLTGEEDRKSLKEAMTKGYVESAFALLILMGVTGSGKSLFQRLVLGLSVPDDSPSTPLAKSAVRSMSVYQVAVDSVKWVIVGPQDMMDKVAKAIKDELPQKDSSNEAFSIPVENPAPLESNNLGSLQPPPELEQDKQESSEVQSQHQETPSQEATHESVFIQALKEINLDSVLIKKMNESSVEAVQKLMDVDFIYLLDSGGQPPFREMLPHFVQRASAIVLFQKLNERLDFKPIIRYREEGGKVDEGYKSHLTNEDILHQYVQGVQHQKSKVFVVGTHRDRESECEDETRETKNKKLLKAFREVLGEQMELYKVGNPDQLIFPLDSTSREPDDEAVAEEFRIRVMDNYINEKKVKIPLPWFIVEQLLQLLAKKMEVQVLSIDECCKAAQDKLNMSRNDCEAAIRYLGELNIVFYRPKILQGIVFPNAQVILDKITELVRCSHALRTGSEYVVPPCMQSSNGLEFKDFGQITSDFLKKAFPSHYRADLFNSSHFLKLLTGLLIAGKLEGEKYFIPSLLPDLPVEEIAQYRVTSPEEPAPPAPLVIYYPKSWVPVGVMPSLVVYLQNICKWELSQTYGKPTHMYHNCIQFKLPGGKPGSVVLIDSIKVLEIHVRPTPGVNHQTLCSKIGHDIITGLKTAHKSLHYDFAKVEMGFLCCSSKCGTEPHLATVDAKMEMWRCSLDEKTGCCLNQHQQHWVEIMKVTAEGDVTISFPLTFVNM